MNTTPAKISTEQSMLITANREEGMKVPRALPRAWDKLTAEEQTLALWFVQNITSYFDKTQVARHIIGVEILANESAGVSPVMTKERADELWKLVYTK
jgi:hypothetical protein